VFLVNSRLGLFAATLSRFRPHGPYTLPGYLFSRSYEAILPSSLKRVISRTLVFSTYPPVAVYGTDIIKPGSRSFSWQCGVCTFGAVAPAHHVSRLNARADFPTRTSYTLEPAHPIAGVHSLLRPSAAHNGLIIVQEYQPDVHRLRLSASP
jgi:hypothetical protein